MAITQVSNSLVKQDLTISGGTVDNTVIGSGTPAAGTFTTITGTLASTVTGTTAAASDNSTKVATTAYVTTALANLVDSAPGTLNTLNELAAALGDDANFSTTVTNSIAAKANTNAPSFTGNATFGSYVGIMVPSLVAFRGNSNEGGLQLGKRAVIFSDTGVTTDLANNSYINSSNQRIAIENDYGSYYQQYQGQHLFNTSTAAEAAGGQQTFQTKMIIDVRGNVGIGTTPPTDGHSSWSQLFIGEKGSLISERLGSSGNYGTLLSDNLYMDADTGSFANITGDESSLYIQEAGAHKFYSQGSGSAGAAVTLAEKLQIDSNGNVGINAAGASNATPLQDFQVIHHSGGGRRGTLYYNQDNKVALASLNASSTWENLAIEGANISLKTGGTTNTDALTIDSSGGVNIGGSTAANKTLEIKGASNNDGYLGTFGSGYSLQVARHPLTGVFNNTSTAAAAINLFTASADSAIAFYTTTSNNANPTERMRIDKNGTVGIGFSQPAHSGLGSMLSVGAQNIVGNGTSGGYVGYNMYYNSGNWKYQVGAGSALLSFAASGDFSLRQATSGSAGNTINYSETFKIERSTGYLIAQGASNVRLVLGSQGNSSNNTSNWIRGNSTEVDINTAGGAFNVELAGSKKLALTASQLELQAGVNLRVASGQGIDFGATTDGFASETSELLDDYEEGTWTPVWQANTQTLSVNSARYVKVGKVVYIYCYISNIYPATSGDTQYISGLPYPVVNATFYGAISIAYAGAASFPNLGNSTASVSALTQNNNTTMYFHTIGGGTQSVMTRNDWNTIYSGLGGTIRALILTGMYEVG